MVYLAEQTEPIQRQVALKIIKLGMDTRQVIARFEVERQALAMMDHPGIARVYDAGATASGRPYFVMQRIHGTPISEYCDHNRLAVAERLRLFAEICHAVQHAHQKGIIHRDLKPANVLVAIDQGQAVSKVIDFGIAKATHQRLTERTLYTSNHQLIGTPQYMSPEQAEFSDIDIDTRSDIYSLGVLLYELLTSTTPLQAFELQRMGYDEICRAILDGDPPTPSRRLSALGDGAVEVANNRHTDLIGLGRLLRGDLDWIVMKALDKNRNRRYETVDAMALDIQRYLAHEPVLARPPSAAYRFQMCVRKYRRTAFATAIVATMIVFSIILFIVDRSRINEQRAIADQQREVAERNLYQAGKLIRRVAAATGQLRQVPDAEQVRSVKTDLLKQTIAFTEEVLQQTPADPEVRLEFGRLCNQLANMAYLAGEETDLPVDHAISVLEDLTTEFPEDLRYRYVLSQAHKAAAQLSFTKLHWKDCITNYDAAHQHLVRLVAEAPDDETYRAELDEVCGMLAYSHQHRGHWKLAEEQYRGALAGEGIVGVVVRQHFADLLISMNQFAEAQTQLDDAMQILSRETPESSWDTAIRDFWTNVVLNEMGRRLICVAEPAEAIDILRRSVDVGQRTSEHLAYSPFSANILGWTYHFLSESLVQNGQADEAIEAARQSLQIWQSAVGRMPLHNAALAHFRLGELLYANGRTEEARGRFELAKSSLEEIAEQVPDEEYCQRRLILLLTNCPDHSFRDPGRALQLAEKVLTDSNGIAWRSLAWGQYRCRAWPEAIASVQHSMQLRAGGDAMDWLLLAMTQWQLNQRAQAQLSYARAQAAISSRQPILYGELGVLGFHRLLSEAASTLQLTMGSADSYSSNRGL